MTGQIIHQMKGNYMEIHKNHVTKPGCVEKVKKWGLLVNGYFSV